MDSNLSCSNEEDMPKTSTHSWREYCAFFQHCRSTELSCLTKSIIHHLDYNYFRLKFFEFFSSFSSIRVFIVTRLFLSLQEKFNELCLIQRLQCFFSINSNQRQRKCYRFKRILNKNFFTFSLQSSQQKWVRTQSIRNWHDFGVRYEAEVKEKSI